MQERIIKIPESIDAAYKIAKEYSGRAFVTIRCTVFNQEKYLAQTLDGFISQKTTFPFIAIIHDDLSTDGSSKIIKQYSEKYPDIIIPYLDTINRYTEGTLRQVMDAATPSDTKYIAFCEGDDYWTDPQKIQKQVEYMETHPECVLTHTDVDVIGALKMKTPKHYDDEPFLGEGHIHSYSIYTLTAVFRKDAYDRTPKHNIGRNWVMGDGPLWIELSREGKFHYIDEITGVYRVLPNSASHSTDVNRIISWWKGSHEIQKFYCELYGYPYAERDRRELYLNIMKQCYANHNKEDAKKYWKKAIKEKCGDLKIFLFFFCNVYNQRWIINLLYRFA